MPRKTRARRRRPGDGGRRFNEAAARCRGKPAAAGAPPRPLERASMRPRPDAAENARGASGRRARDRRASMRPRPDAAENLHLRCRPRAPFRASMRPRPDAAENSDGSTSRTGRSASFNEAAARCRGKPARPPFPCRGCAGRFNEAAARCRGKRRDRPRVEGVQGASMRPRPDAAENPRRPGIDTGWRPGFNEAAARCRGKHSRPSPRCRTAACGFNEAAARCRGKRIHGLRLRRAGDASMRPRPDAAENTQEETAAGQDFRLASMRPRPDAAENGGGGTSLTPIR